MILLNSEHVHWYLFEHANCKITPTKQAYILLTTVNLAPYKDIQKEVTLCDQVLWLTYRNR